jgi:ADP-ribosylglycohydrolase
VCCALYCLWARREFAGSSDAWRSAVAWLREHYQAYPEHLEQLEFHVRPDEDGVRAGSGYVVDCLRSAQWAVESQNNYRDTVLAAIRLGHDTDTTACVAGGVAGIRHGFDAIPAEWMRAMRGAELVEPLLARLELRWS